MPKRDDPVAPPTRGQEWEIRYADSDAVTGWQNLLTQVPGTLREAWDRMRTAPDTRTTNQTPLAGPLAQAQSRHRTRSPLPSSTDRPVCGVWPDH